MTSLLSKLVSGTRLIALYALTGVVIFGVSLSFLMGRNERSLSNSHQEGATINREDGQDEMGEDCRKVEVGKYDCTDEATREKVYEAAKKGLKWYTKPESSLEKLSSVCEAQGIKESDCPLILKAIATQESYFGKVMVGDGGRSAGWFHILDIHKLSMGCANSLECSAAWSLKRLIRNGFLSPSKKWWAVGTHNSYTPEINKRYAGEVKAKFEKLLASK